MKQRGILENKEGDLIVSLPKRRRVDFLKNHDNNILSLQNLPAIALRNIIRMLPKITRDNLRLVSRWLSETMVTQDASFRCLKICLDNSGQTEQIFNKMKVKESYINNNVRVHFVFNFYQKLDANSSSGKILMEWKDKVYKLSIYINDDMKFISDPNITLKNLEYLQIRSTSAERTKCPMIKNLIDRHAQTLKTLRLFRISELNLQSKILPMLSELTVNGLRVGSMTSLLRICCNTLVHLDVHLCNYVPKLHSDIDIKLPSLKYLSIHGLMNDLSMNVLKQNAHQFIGLNIIVDGFFEYDVTELNMPSLKFLYINTFNGLPKSCPRLEFLLMNRYSRNGKELDRPSLPNLKALIFPFLDPWAIKIIKDRDVNLDFVHFTKVITIQDRISTKNRFPKIIKLLLPIHEKGNFIKMKQWLLDYVSRNSLYSKMLKIQEDDSMFETIHNLNAPEPISDLWGEYAFWDELY